ncbi:MAG: hypothetical protein WA903_00920 [Ornithinimicrobium sp.]
MTEVQRRDDNPSGERSQADFKVHANELARHAGHPDITREQLDGATAIELAFAIEGREGNDYVTPWTPASS